MTTSTLVKKSRKVMPTYEGLYLKMKAQMMIKLGYDEKKAAEEAKTIAGFYKSVFAKMQ
jgi:hypothetical protein